MCLFPLALPCALLWHTIYPPTARTKHCPYPYPYPYPLALASISQHYNWHHSTITGIALACFETSACHALLYSALLYSTSLVSFNFVRFVRFARCRVRRRCLSTSSPLSCLVFRVLSSVYVCSQIPLYLDSCLVFIFMIIVIFEV